MKVIFLDFDGVLNSIRSAVAFGGYPWNVNKESLKLFDLVGVALIRKACKEHDYKIILSSTWRKCFPFKELGEALDLPIVDKTPIIALKGRGYEIDRWLKNNYTEKYIIIDDDGDMLEYQKEFFIHTDYIEGLTYKNYLDLIKLMEE